MRAKLTAAVVCMGLLLAVRPLVAHHSFAAEFDADNPVQLRGVVTGMDITHDPAHGLVAGDVAEQLRLSRDPRIKYIISNRRIANFQALGGQPAYAWRPYAGANPHDKHFHISVKPGKTGPDGYDTTSDWNIQGGAMSV